MAYGRHADRLSEGHSTGTDMRQCDESHCNVADTCYFRLLDCCEAHAWHG
jgi:hypothetical protein